MPAIQQKDACQILIIGSGLPGAVLALVLAKLGFKVAVIDRSSHPRFSIGESSTPTTDAYVSLIADEFEIPELKPLSTYRTTKAFYPELTIGNKRGFSYFWHEKGKEFSPKPDHRNEILVAASPSDEKSDSQWLRSDIDSKIVSWFEKYGIEFWDSSTIHAIERNSGGWQFTLTRDESTKILHSEFFVDASGSSGIGVKATGASSKLDQMWTNTSALFAHFSNVRKWGEMVDESAQTDYPFACDSSAIHHLLREGWMWQLRFDSGITSCGIVQANTTKPNSNDSLNTADLALEKFRNTCEKYPSLAEQFASSSVIVPSSGAYFRERLQHWYRLGPIDRWCALPNTIGFVDPLHSKGLAHALSGVYRIGTVFREEAETTFDSVEPKLIKLMSQFDSEIEFLDRLIFICYRSMNRFELFKLATFWYFAAATNFEHLCATDKNLDRPFLFTENREYVESLFRYSVALKESNPETAIQGNEMSFLARELLTPFDRVGLFDPAIPNMYPHASAPVDLK